MDWKSNWNFILFWALPQLFQLTPYISNFMIQNGLRLFVNIVPISMFNNEHFQIKTCWIQQLGKENFDVKIFKRPVHIKNHNLLKTYNCNTAKSTETLMRLAKLSYQTGWIFFFKFTLNTKNVLKIDDLVPKTESKFQR